MIKILNNNEEKIYSILDEKVDNNFISEEFNKEEFVVRHLIKKRRLSIV
jgi:hypothetical protein